MAQVTKETTIGELLAMDPNSAAILMRAGMHWIIQKMKQEKLPV